MPSRRSTTRATSALSALSAHLLGEPPGAVHSISGPSERPLARREFELHDPDDLLGFVAPPSWRGIVVVLEGRAHTVETPGIGPRPAPGPEPEPVAPAGSGRARDADGCVTIAVAADRTGRMTATAAERIPAEVRARATPTVLGGPVEGLVADIIRRVLQLPCTPERAGTDVLVVSEWLRDLLDAVADPATAHLARTWPQAVALHPLASSLVRHRAEPTPIDVAAATVASAHRVTRSRLRAEAVSGAVDLCGPDAADAAWMDDPCFARWMLGLNRPVADLLDDLSLFLDGLLLAAVTSSVRAVDWLGCGPSSPDEPPGAR